MDIKQKDMYIRSLIILFSGVLGLIFYFISYDIATIIFGLCLLICGIIFLILARAKKFPNKSGSSNLGIILIIIILFFVGFLHLLSFAFFPPHHRFFYLLTGILIWVAGGYYIWYYFNKEEIQELK